MIAGDRRAALALAAIVLFAGIRIVAQYPVFSATFDEPAHFTAGLEILQQGSYRSELRQPPLARLLLAIPPYLGGTRADMDLPFFERAVDTLVGRGDYWTTLTLARSAALPFALGLIVLTYFWGRRLFGSRAGTAAAVVVSACPLLLGHGALATPDLPATLGFALTGFFFLGWVRAGGWANALASSVCAVVSLSMKYSAIGFLPAMLLAFLMVRWAEAGAAAWTPERRRALVRQAAAALALFAVLCWAGWGFDVGPLSDPENVISESIDRYLPPESSLRPTALYLLREASYPAPGLWDGVALAMRLSRTGGHAQYFLGEGKIRGGWPHYFPVAIAVKTTLPLLALLLLATARSTEGEVRWNLIYLAAAAAAVLAVGLNSRLNMGLRHLALLYPLFAMAAGSLFREDGWRSCITGRLATALVAAHFAVSLAAHPDYIAFFNLASRSHADYLLGDSNLDWGQDLARLSRELRERGVERPYLRIFSSTPPEALGIADYRTLEPGERPTGWIAISTTPLQGYYFPGDESRYRWLLEHEPVARIGASIRLYRIDGAD